MPPFRLLYRMFQTPSVLATIQSQQNIHDLSYQCDSRDILVPRSCLVIRLCYNHDSFVWTAGIEPGLQLVEPQHYHRAKSAHFTELNLPRASLTLFSTSNKPGRVLGSILDKGGVEWKPNIHTFLLWPSNRTMYTTVDDSRNIKSSGSCSFQFFLTPKIALMQKC